MKVLVTECSRFYRVKFCKASYTEIGADVHMVDLFKPSSADKEFYEVVKNPTLSFLF